MNTSSFGSLRLEDSHYRKSLHCETFCITIKTRDCVLKDILFIYRSAWRNKSLCNWLGSIHCASVTKLFILTTGFFFFLPPPLLLPQKKTFIKPSFSRGASITDNKQREEKPPNLFNLKTCQTRVSKMSDGCKSLVLWFFFFPSFFSFSQRVRSLYTLKMPGSQDWVWGESPPRKKLAESQWRSKCVVFNLPCPFPFSERCFFSPLLDELHLHLVCLLL